jgi:hypothetical protein
MIWTYSYIRDHYTASNTLHSSYTLEWFKRFHDNSKIGNSKDYVTTDRQSISTAWTSLIIVE